MDTLYETIVYYKQHNIVSPRPTYGELSWFVKNSFAGNIV